MEYKCLRCNQVFVDSASHKRKFCSIHCARGSVGPCPNPPISRCLKCGIEFIVHAKSSGKYCSQSCVGSDSGSRNLDEKRYIKPRSKYISSACANCGTEYKRWSYKIGKYCSLKCAIATNSQKRIGIPPSDATRAKQRAALIGKKRPSHVIEKMKEYWTPERRRERGVLVSKNPNFISCMKGRRHRPESKVKMSAAKSGENHPLYGKKRNPSEILKTLKTKVRLYGCAAPNVKRSNWKAGWRTIGGQKIYARSRWEANYARYLELLKQAGEISQWEHEPETFWFDKIKRGVRSYLPDFRVTDNIGAIEFHEVKGWNDARSKTKARRMKKYFPEVTVRLIDGKWFSANRTKLSGIIQDWEK